jgi:hypothetical protein
MINGAAGGMRTGRSDRITRINSALVPLHPTNSLALVRERTTRPSDRGLSAKLVPTFAHRGVSHGRCGRSSTAVISAF